METTEDKVFIYIPHALDCEFYIFMLEEAKRLGRPVTVVDAS